jgi:hypothetical protein
MVDADERYVTETWHGSPAAEASVGRALVLPGGYYSVDQPLLFWACHVLAQASWRVVTMRWRWEDTEDRLRFVEDGAARLDLEAGPAARTLVVAKSLGCYAAAWASAHDYPAVWLTPVLTDDFVADALGRYSTSALLVGGSADRVWDSARATGTGLRRLEISGADHGLQLPDWRSSIAVLQQTLTAIDDFACEVAAET